MDMKKVTLAVLMIAGLGVLCGPAVYATIAHYLSPSVQATATVYSPLSLNITDATQGTTNGTVVEFGDVAGGSTMDATMDIYNLANNPIVNSTMEIRCWNSADDMTADSVSFKFDGVSLAQGTIINGTLYAYTDAADYPPGTNTHVASVTPDQAYLGDLTCGFMEIPDGDRKA